MATYVIGDIQGCRLTLERLLVTVGFDPGRDRLWLVGDLVNRGPDSAGVLRLLRGLGDAVTCVLGNHDLHLLARATGNSPAKPLDTLDDVLAAPDRDELLTWLAARPLLHREKSLTLVHAGLLPEWTVDAAAAEARRLETALRREPRAALGQGRQDPALRALTTLRTCRKNGTPCKFSGAPADAPADCVPWFAHPLRRSRGSTVFFGHWAALGLALGPDYVGLDTGCVWGRELTALRLEDRQIWSIPSVEPGAKRDDGIET